jgi:hypothetical protein
MTATLVKPYRPSREAGLSGSGAKSLTPRRPAAALLLPRARFGFMLLRRTATHSLQASSPCNAVTRTGSISTPTRPGNANGQLVRTASN